MIILMILLLLSRIDYQLNWPPYLDLKVSMTLQALAIQLSATFASFSVFFFSSVVSISLSHQKNPFSYRGLNLRTS